MAQPTPKLALLAGYKGQGVEFLMLNSHAGDTRETITADADAAGYGLPIILVDFTTHKNRVAIPWQKHWFRDEWLELVSTPADPSAVDRTSSATGQGQTAAGIAS